MSLRCFRLAALTAVVALGLALIAGAPARADLNPDSLLNGLTQIQKAGQTPTVPSLSVAPQVGWDAGLEKMQPPSAPWYRLWDMKVAWRDINPAPGVFDWSILDRRVAQVESWGGRPLLVLGLTPQWAAADPSAGDPRWGAGSASPPADMNTWFNYVSNVASRYGDRIGAYEVWNEANLRTFWTGSAEQMADMTGIARDSIKAASQNATVLTPSVTTRLSSGGRFSAAFFRALFEDDKWSITRRPFDAWAVHTYPAGNAGVTIDGTCNAEQIEPDGEFPTYNVVMPFIEAKRTNETVKEYEKRADVPAKLVRWFKSEGQLVAADEPLAEVSNGKTTARIPSPASGILTRIVAPEGSTVNVGSPIAVITDGATPQDCVSGRSPTLAALQRVNDVRQWQQAILNAGATGFFANIPIWDTEVNYGLAGPGIIPGFNWTDAQGAQLMRHTLADSQALGIENTFWYQFTAQPFDLLGVQMTPGTPETLAAWKLPVSEDFRSSRLPYNVPVINGCPLTGSGDGSSRSVSCPGANFKSTTLSGFNFGPVALLSGADFLEADLRRSLMTNALVRDARFFKANMNGFDGRQSDFIRSNMRQIDGFEANFRLAKLRNVDFRKADLRRANFSGADLQGADFRGADLRGANFCDAAVASNFVGAKTAGAKCL